MTAGKDSKQVTLDEVLSKFSVFGGYHIYLGTLIFISFVANGINCSQFIFSAQRADYRCHHSLNVCDVRPSNLTEDKFNSKCYERVSLFEDVSCDNATNTKLVPCRRWSYDDPTGFVSEFNLACEEWKRTLVGTMHSFGYMIGLLIVGPLSDRLGRKKALIMTGVLGSVFGVTRSFVNNYWLYIVLEMLEAAIGDICSPAFMIVVEAVATKDRAKYYMLTQFGYQAGGLLLALAAWGFPYFRTFLRIIYAPSLLFIIYSFLIDESPRWLLTKGRKDEAVAILEKAAKRSNIVLEKSMLENLSYEEEDKGKDIGYAVLLKSTFNSKVLLGRFLICIVWWITSTFVSYGLAINSVLLQGNKYVNYAVMTLVDIPAALIMGYVLIYFKRKKPLCVSFCGAAIFFLIQPFLPTGMPWLAIMFFMAGKFMCAIFFNITYVFTSELFPTYTRNSMHALCSSLGRIGSMVAPQTPLLLHYWTGLPATLFGGMSLLAALLTLLVPDTADDSLPDTVRQAETVGAKMKSKNVDVDLVVR